MQATKRSQLLSFSVLGLCGALLWVLTIFLRETSVVQNPTVNFWLGIAPNFGIGLLFPMLLVNFYPILFKKDLSYTRFLYGLVMISAALLMSEIVHTMFLDSGFDIFDLVASLLALSIMAWLYHAQARQRIQ